MPSRSKARNIHPLFPNISVLAKRRFFSGLYNNDSCVACALVSPKTKHPAFEASQRFQCPKKSLSPPTTAWQSSTFSKATLSRHCLPRALKSSYSLMTKSKTASRSEEHTSELQSQSNLVCRLLLEKKKKTIKH